MKKSKNNIENRGVTAKQECSVCNSKIKHTAIVQNGKTRMAKMCNCKGES